MHRVAAMVGRTASPAACVWTMARRCGPRVGSTFPPGVEVPAEFTLIGTIREGAPGEVTVDGVARTPGGWDSARGAN